MSSEQASAASHLDASAASFSVSAPEFTPELQEFVPEYNQSPTRGPPRRKGSSSKRSPNQRARPLYPSEPQAPLSIEQFPALTTNQAVVLIPQGLWEDTSKLKMRPDTEEFIPKASIPEFEPSFSFSTELNFTANEFIPSVGAEEFIPPTEKAVLPPPSDTPPTTIPSASRLEAEAKSPEPPQSQQLPPTDAAETGSSESETQKVDVQLIPDSQLLVKVYSPELIRKVGHEDRTRVVTLERVRALMERTITEASERRQFMKRVQQRPEVVQTSLMRAAEVQQSPAAASPWRMERTMEQKRLEAEAKAYRARLTMEKDEEEKIKRSIKITLNKLSPGNFDRLKVQLLDLAKQSEAILLLLSRGIFDKACSEMKFTELYAALCQFLSHEYASFQQTRDGTSIDPVRFKDMFKKNVLYVCQEVFEADPSEHDFAGLTEEEVAAKKAAIKKRTLGNVRFIGELFKVGFISARTVLNCVYDMTHPMMKEEQDFREIDLDEVTEDKLEGAVMLLKTGGNKFIEPKLREKTNYIMRFLEHIISSERLSARVKFLLMNILDMHREGWTQKTSL